METKVCNKCKEEKPIEAFGLDKRNTDGYKSVCRVCLSEYKKNYVKLNQAKVDEYNKLYREENKDKIKEYEKKRCREFSDEIKQYRKEYKEIHKERDREKNNKTKREYNKKRCAIDPLYKLKINIRSLIAGSIKKSGYRKNTKTVSILGSMVEEFKLYIESKFESWMSWENYGKYNGTEGFGWDIDHIIPISSASTEEEVIALNHYSNLQPLCSYINRYVKKNKK